MTKPGIIYGNIFHVLAGLGIASYAVWSWTSALSVVVGSGLIIASACVINNIFDRDMDRHMQRTAKRALVVGEVSIKHAASFAAITGLLGFIVLGFGTNHLTFWLGVIGYISYAFIYTYSKRTTIHSTLIGTVPGALPAVAGYTALTDKIDGVAIVTFLLLVIWQLAHFYAIAIYRAREYKAAHVKLLSHVLDSETLKRLINTLIVIYFLLAILMLAVGALDWRAGIVLLLLTVWWCMVGFTGPNDENAWARRVFHASLIVSTGFMATAGLNLLIVRFL